MCIPSTRSCARITMAARFLICVSRSGATKAFRELEACAGVAHVPGRGRYGLRRVAADLAEEMTSDDRVKDRLGGWRRAETRKYIYQDRVTYQLRTAAAVVRRRMRLGTALDSDASTQNENTNEVRQVDVN